MIRSLLGKEGSESSRPREKHLPSYGGERSHYTWKIACYSEWQGSGSEAGVGR